jgi:L-fuculose-phosphate aldolase
MPTDQLVQDVATACRVLEREGQEHGFLGHVSAREQDSDVMLVKPAGLGLGEVTPEDVLTLGLDGTRKQGTRPAHAEMPIHSRIYRRRPDVGSVVHTHPLWVAALTASDAGFQMVNQDSVLFSDGVGVYPSAMLVVTDVQGDELAEALGDRRAVLLQNHGLVTVGATVQEAVFLAVAFVNSLRVQVLARQLGEVVPIAPSEVQVMAEHIFEGYGRRVESTWSYLQRRVAVPAGRSDGRSPA